MSDLYEHCNISESHLMCETIMFKTYDICFWVLYQGQGNQGSRTNSPPTHLFNMHGLSFLISIVRKSVGMVSKRPSNFVTLRDVILRLEISRKF